MRAAKNCLAKTFYHMVLIKSSLVLFLAFIPACFIFSFTAFGLFWWKIANQYVGFVMFSFSMHGESLIFFIFLIIYTRSVSSRDLATKQAARDTYPLWHLLTQLRKTEILTHFACNQTDRLFWLPTPFWVQISWASLWVFFSLRQLCIYFFTF